MPVTGLDLKKIVKKSVLPQQCSQGVDRMAYVGWVNLIQRRSLPCCSPVEWQMHFWSIGCGHANYL